MADIPDPIFVIDDPPWTTDPVVPSSPTMEVGDQLMGAVRLGSGVDSSRPD